MRVGTAPYPTTIYFFSCYKITGNTAEKGGSIYTYGYDKFDITIRGSSRITGNRAIGSALDPGNPDTGYDTDYADGGGIYSEDYSYLSIAESVVFRNNFAANRPQSENEYYDYGIDNLGLHYTVEEGGYGDPGDIFWYGYNSIPGSHLLNNYDVSYTGIPMYCCSICCPSTLTAAMALHHRPRR